MFKEAQAAQFVFVSPATSVSTQQEFIVELTLPTGQNTPITTVDAILERQRDGGPGKLNPIVVSRARCAMGVGFICSAAPSSGEQPLTIVQGDAVAIFKIRTIEVLRQSTRVALSSGYFGTFGGGASITSTGYGYDIGAGGSANNAVTGGYGYGYNFNTGGATLTDGALTQGYGYTAGGDGIIIRYGITVNPSSLASGTLYLTVLARTGSATIGDISTPFTQFTWASGGSGGGGGGGSGGDGGSGGGSTASVEGSATTTSQGASATYAASYSGNPVSTLNVNLPDAATVDNLVLTISPPSGNLQVTVNEYTSFAGMGSAIGQSGTFAEPLGVTGLKWFTITVTGGTTTKATFVIDVPLTTMGQLLRNHVFLLHGKSPGVEHIKPTALPDSNGEAHFQVTTTGLSPFALLADDTLPEVTLTVPSGSLSGIKQITATATDNVKVERLQFFVDGVLQSTVNGATGSFNWNTGNVADGAHTLQVKAFDFVDNEKATSQSVVTANGATTSPGPGDGGPGDGGGGGPSIWIWIVLLVIAAAVVAAIVVASKRRKGGAPPP